MSKECVICNNQIKDPYGHNAEPVKEGKCCEHCNQTVVIPHRLNWFMEKYANQNKRDQNKEDERN